MQRWELFADLLLMLHLVGGISRQVLVDDWGDFATTFYQFLAGRLQNPPEFYGLGTGTDEAHAAAISGQPLEGYDAWF